MCAYILYAFRNVSAVDAKQVIKIGVEICDALDKLIGIFIDYFGE